MSLLALLGIPERMSGSVLVPPSPPSISISPTTVIIYVVLLPRLHQILHSRHPCLPRLDEFAHADAPMLNEPDQLSIGLYAKRYDTAGTIKSCLSRNNHVSELLLKKRTQCSAFDLHLECRKQKIIFVRS